MTNKLLPIFVRILECGILFFPVFCWASGHSAGGHGHSSEVHHGKITDLIPSVVNFSILITFLIIKARKVLKEYFYHYSHTVQANVERAEAKSKEAQIKFEMFDRKIKESHLECDSIRKNVESDFANYARNFKMEMQKKSERMRAESILRLEREKTEYLQKLNEEFLNSIIGKATNSIEASQDIQSKVTKKILRAI